MLINEPCKMGDTFIVDAVIHEFDLKSRLVKNGDTIIAKLRAGRSHPFKSGMAICDIYSLQGELLMTGAKMEIGGFSSKFNQKEGHWEFFCYNGTPCAIPTPDLSKIPYPIRH